MKKKIWDLYAPIYERAMRADANIYEFMYARIPKVIRGKEVLEIATGPGLLAKHVAPAAKRMVATDYSDGMIREANKGERPSNLTFEVADATELPYMDDSFDVVLIANALHVMPEPEKALSEINRVLRLDGILIAPKLQRSFQPLRGAQGRLHQPGMVSDTEGRRNPVRASVDGTGIPRLAGDARLARDVFQTDVGADFIDVYRM